MLCPAMLCDCAAVDAVPSIVVLIVKPFMIPQDMQCPLPLLMASRHLPLKHLMSPSLCSFLMLTPHLPTPTSPVFLVFLVAYGFLYYVITHDESVPSWTPFLLFLLLFYDSCRYIWCRSVPYVKPRLWQASLKLLVSTCSGNVTCNL